jgi:3-oxoacyl-[acyl-carrier-protein] synthase II
VVITGTGTVTPFGLGTGALWSALCEGKSGIGPCRTFDFSGFPTPFVAQVPDELFDVKSVVPKSYRKATKVMARDIELAVGAAMEAMNEAKLQTKAHESGAVTIPPARFGCHIGAGLIAAEENELTGALATARAADGSFDIGAWGGEGMKNLTPLWMLKYLPNMLACHVTIIHDCQGPSNTITCAEASSLLSIGESMRVIGRGDADACISGGAESKTNLMGMMRQLYAKRLAATAPGEDPAGVVRPFAPDAKGCVPGEGGGLLVLEAMETAAAVRRRSRSSRASARARASAPTRSASSRRRTGRASSTRSRPRSRTRASGRTRSTRSSRSARASRCSTPPRARRSGRCSARARHRCRS